MQQQGNNLIGLTFFLVNGHFITVPTTVEMADKVMEEWAAGKYRDRNCESCGGLGGQPESQGSVFVKKPCLACHGDGKVVFFLKGTCPVGSIPKWVIKMGDVKMIHSQIFTPEIIQQLRGVGQATGPYRSGV